VSAPEHSERHPAIVGEDAPRAVEGSNSIPPDRLVEVGVVEVLDLAAVLPRIRFERQETLRRTSRRRVRKAWT
jgi:hypothetical protein